MGYNTEIIRGIKGSPCASTKVCTTPVINAGAPAHAITLSMWSSRSSGCFQRKEGMIACHNQFGANLFLRVGNVASRWSDRAAAGWVVMPRWAMICTQVNRGGVWKGLMEYMSGVFRRNLQGKIIWMLMKAVSFHLLWGRWSFASGSICLLKPASYSASDVDA